MLVIDLNSGRAEFTKLAACRSYILRKGRIIAVEGGQLPLGILDEINPGIQETQLERGDIIYMMTDGVTDALGEKSLAETMRGIKETTGAEMARRLVDAAAMRAGRRDDMTAVCIRVM